MISLEQFEAELQSWHRTPYKDTMMRKGVGVDCIRFVVAMADFIHGWNTSSLPKIPLLPKQTALHSKLLAWDVVRWMEQRYPHKTKWSQGRNKDKPDVSPGDIICIKNEVHPGHVLIAGTRKNVFWHSINGVQLDFGGHVHETNLHWCMSTGLVRVWSLIENKLCLS